MPLLTLLTKSDKILRIAPTEDFKQLTLRAKYEYFHE